MTLRAVERDSGPVGGLFDGIRVVDTSTGIAGPYATMFLADHGADVVKVEPPGGDPYRASPGFQTLNRGKRSAVIDLTSDSGRQRFTVLARSADVVVVDEPQSRAAALGIDYASLVGPGPSPLIYLGMPPFGERGPFVDREASPGLLAAASGMAAGQGSFSGDPVSLVLPLAQYGAAALGAAAIAGGLYARERRGLGQFIEVSELAGALALQVGAVRSDQVPPMPAPGPHPAGSLGRLPAYRLYQAGDERWFFLACGSPAFFHRMLIAIGQADLAADPRLEHAPWGLGTPEASDLLIPMLEALFQTRPCDDWIALFREADVPAQPVLTRDEYFASRVVAANEMRVIVDHPAIGRIEMMGVPLVTEAAPGMVRGPAPAIGEHTDEVLGEAATGPPPVARLHPDAAPGSMLDGVRVLDLSAFIAGPVATRHLAMLGADVIKIEPPTGDPFRQMGLGFLGWNQGKRGLALNLTRDDARAVLYRLAKDADVVVENFRPGVAERLGADYETLREHNPDLIYLSSSGWGDDQAMRGDAAFDPLVQAISGAMHAQGGADEPVFHAVPLNDVMTPAIGAFGVLAALFHRARGGGGQRVRTSLARTGLAIQAAEFTRFPRRVEPEPEESGHTDSPGDGQGPAVERSAGRSTGTNDDEPADANAGAPTPIRPIPATVEETPVARAATELDARSGRASPASAFAVGARDFPGPSAARRWYRCGDGAAIYVEANSGALRRALAATAGAAVAAATLAAPYGTAPCRSASDALASAFATRTRDEWIVALDAAGVPCAPVVTRDELLDCDFVTANELVVHQDDPQWGRTANTGMLIRALGTPGRIERPAPQLSEHAAEILDALGYSAAEQAALAEAGAVLLPPR